MDVYYKSKLSPTIPLNFYLTSSGVTQWVAPAKIKDTHYVLCTERHKIMGYGPYIA
jgi:hypothetical protein